MGYKLKNVSKSFNEKTVLNNICFEFPHTGTVVLEGASGCGKTTLLNIISGILKPDSGDVLGFEGKNFSFVFQDDRLISWLSAKENLKIIKNTDDAKATYYLDLVGLNEFYDTKSGEMSGGMKKKLAVARALAFDGDIFLLDEPFSGLDDSSKIKILNDLKRIFTHKLVIFATHNKNDLQNLLKKDINYSVLKI